MICIQFLLLFVSFISILQLNIILQRIHTSSLLDLHTSSYFFPVTLIFNFKVQFAIVINIAVIFTVFSNYFPDLFMIKLYLQLQIQLYRYKYKDAHGQLCKECREKEYRGKVFFSFVISRTYGVWRDVSLIKAIDCSSKGSRFNFQCP